MIDFTQMTTVILLIFVFAKLFSVLCDKINVSPLVGELLGGIVLGNLTYFGISYDVTQTILTSSFFAYAAELGVVLLLFLVGLESNLKDLLKAGLNSTITATIGVVLPTLMGCGIVMYLGLGNFIEGLFVGATFAATSVGVTAKILADAKKLKTPSAQIILGAAVIDDVMGLVLLAVLSGVAATGTFAMYSVALISFKTILFFVVAFLVGHYVIPQGFRLYKSIDQPGILTPVVILIALVFASLAHFASLAPIVGAFAAGILLDDVTLRHSDDIKINHIEDVVHPIVDFLLPIFFVSIGVQVKLATLFSAQNFLIIFTLLIIAVVGKMLCGFACVGKNLDRIGIGIGMIPRGEVGLIFASYGVAHGIVKQDLYSILVIVVLLTTMIAPILLKWRLPKFVEG